MTTYRKQIETMQYHLSLLLQTIDKEKFPFYYILVKNQIEKEEIENFLQFCENMNKNYEMQKAEGLLWYAPLLTEFEKALPQKLVLRETVEAMEKQNLFRPLMLEFLKLMKKRRY
jgi:hypothetical protein